MKKTSLLCIILAFLILLAACRKAPAEGDGENDAPADENAEYVLTDDSLKTDFICDDNARVFYEIFVGSFSDSDGDGTGDLRGIINRFDYLNDGDDNSGLSLGVEGIWLSPIFSSPSYHKYDVTDYYKVDEKFGTLDDLCELISLCHERNVKIILDLPINHTSTANLWFTKFVNAHKANDPTDEYYGFYSWSPEAKTGFSSITGSSDYYECNFTGSMPEPDFDNPAVRETMLDIAKYYLDLGVDGFRFDAAKYIYYGDNPESASFWDWYMAELRKINPDIFTVAEVWDADAVTMTYYTSTDCFDFAVSGAEGKIAAAAKKGSVNVYTAYVDDYLDSIGAKRDGALYMPFVSNHDMDRAAGYLTVASGFMKCAANLYILGPGAPFIYYGEEIGMRGSRGSASTDANRRLAMYWGDGDTVRDPYGSTYGGTMNQTNGCVANLLPNGDSLYNHYKKLIMIRKANPEIARGDYKALTLDGKAGGFTSTYDGKTVAVIHNTTENPVTVDLTSAGIGGMEISAFVGVGGASVEGNILTLDGQTSVVLR